MVEVLIGIVVGYGLSLLSIIVLKKVGLLGGSKT